jgi:lipoprotein NlpD
MHSQWGGLPAMRVLVVAMACMLTGCAANKARAPVEDRVAAAPAVSATAVPTEPALPGAENAGKPGYYTVKPGDKLIRIALDNGQNWRDLVKWNKLDNPNVIEVGQVLRVVPPAADATVATTRPVPPARLDVKPIERTAPAASPAPPAGASSPAPTATAPTVVAPASTPAPVAREGDDDVNWMWPATGAVVVSFDDTRSKGLAIAGKAGDPVVAAADGRVVYAGSGLRGYGNLLIVKHNNTYLTAYAHNQALLVKEDQAVRRGQRIAEMGATDAERVQLHFEIRRLGKPIDPAKLLPPR